MDNIRIIHLVNGQTVVARIEETEVEAQGDQEGGRMVVAVKPMVIFSSPGPGGRLSVSLVPFGSLFGVLPPVENLVLFDHLVMCPMFEAPEHLANEYIKATSGIAIAQAPGVGQALAGLAVN